MLSVSDLSKCRLNSVNKFAMYLLVEVIQSTICNYHFTFQHDVHDVNSLRLVAVLELE